MTREDIIAMAREAEIEPNSYQGWLGIDELERFADLVAAAEREACAKVCEHDFGNGALNLADAIRARGQV